MKYYFKYLASVLVAASALTFTSCVEKPDFDAEQYEKLVYALSSTYSEFAVVHQLTDENVDAYVAVGLSGTQMAQGDVFVTFERNDSVLNAYNIINYDLDSTNYAREIDPSRYTCDDWTAVIEEGTCKGAIRLSVNITGLSPDSIWTIPLAIKSVSGTYDGINEDLQLVLYRFNFENEYASVADWTTYLAKGYAYDTEGDSAAVAASKRAFPISKNKTRTTVHNTTAYSTLDNISDNGIVFEVLDDNSIIVTACDESVLDIRNTGVEGDNIWAMDYMGSYRFYVHYEYRRKGSDGSWGEWTRVQENYMTY